MSWQDRINRDFEIITGDGEVWKPLWKESEKAIGFNVKGYEFIEVEGTYVDRKLAKGNQIPIDFYFMGENHIDEYEAFEVSAKDPNPWTIIHPYYGKLKVQPISMQVDHKTLNQSRVQVSVWETIDLKYPTEKADLKQFIVNTKTNLDSFVDDILTFELEDVKSASVNRFDQAIKRIGNALSKIPMPNEQFAELKDRLRLATGAVANVLSTANAFVQSTIALINFPLLLIDDVKSAVDRLSDSIDDLFDVLFEDDYKTFEAFANVAISCASQVIAQQATNPNNTRVDLVVLQNKLTEIYNTHITRIDSPPIVVTGVPLVPDSEMANQLDLIVNLTINSLFEIALIAKQERIITLNEDTNLVVLAKQYYDGGDSGLEELLKNNDIHIDEYMIVKIGKQFLYYV